MSVQYVVRRGLIDGIDYNGDGVIDENDDVVVKYVDGKPVEQFPLTKSLAKKLQNIMAQPPQPGEPVQRVVYSNIRSDNNNPIRFQDDTGFVRSFKNAAGTGAGFAVGQSVVEGAFGLLGSLFDSDGGGRRRSRTRKSHHIRSSKKK